MIEQTWERLKILQGDKLFKETDGPIKLTFEKFHLCTGELSFDVRLIYSIQHRPNLLTIKLFTLQTIQLIGSGVVDCEEIEKLQILPRLTQHMTSSINSSDFARMLSPDWRLSTDNEDYSLCPSYSSVLVVPSKIPDSALRHAAAFRAHRRLPILAYLHPINGAALVRAGAPLVGLTGKRSSQDEHILASVRGEGGSLIIVDARPTVNALASAVGGAGFEPLDNYPGCQRLFVNIENIHVIRRAYFRLLNGEAADWNHHCQRILSAVGRIVQAMDMDGASVLVHCSDGWDRTSQLVSLAKACLDPHYRTLAGLADLIETDWLGAGHRFGDRLAHHRPPLSIDSEDNGHEVWDWMKRKINGTTEEQFCPIFPQFLDCLGRILAQQPSAFEYDQITLHRLYVEALANRSGIFSGNFEAERSSQGMLLKFLQSGSDTHVELCHGVLLPTLDDSETIFGTT